MVVDQDIAIGEDKVVGNYKIVVRDMVGEHKQFAKEEVMVKLQGKQVIDEEVVDEQPQWLQRGETDGGSMQTKSSQHVK